MPRAQDAQERRNVHSRRRTGAWKSMRPGREALGWGHWALAPILSFPRKRGQGGFIESGTIYCRSASIRLLAKPLALQARVV